MRKAIILGCIAVALLAALNLWTWRQLTTQREEAGALREQLARVRSTPPVRAATQAREIGEAMPPADTTSQAAVPGLGMTFSTSMAELFQDPEYLRAWRMQVRSNTEAIYPDVQRALKLPPDLANRLYELLVDHTYAMNESMVRAVDGQRDDAADEARVQKEQDEIAALLGPGRTKAWDDYKENLEFRAEANRLRVEMGGGPDGLRDDQVEALVPIFRAASETTPDTRSPTDFIPSMEPIDPASWETNGELNRQRQKAIHAHILEGARSILDPRQFAELERKFRRREELDDASAVLEKRVIQIDAKGMAGPAPAPD